MKIAVIGRGNVGGGLAQKWRDAGHEVQELGREGGDASTAEVVLVAVPGPEIANALAGGGGLAGEVTSAATPIPTSTQKALLVPETETNTAAEKSTDEHTATPTAPPICCAVLISPEASPASSWLTPASAAIEIGMKVNGSAKPMRR